MRHPQTKLEQMLIDDFEPIVREKINTLDPIKLLKRGSPKNKYEKEIREIVFRLKECVSDLDVAEIIYIVFAYSFTPSLARPEKQYLIPGREIMRFMIDKDE